ncbi:MAG TPA: S8 family serine peptidase [Anaerolineales bacterium]|nr:S8 family serine peptidase [Anaerolineales bacterium]
MTEVQVDLNGPITPQNRSTGALVLFLMFALPMPLCLLIYHYILWFTEQFAIASGSLANLAWAGTIGLAAQAFVTTSMIGGLWYFTKDDRFKPVYAGWLGAALMAFPALALRFFGPNNDQVGSLYQISMCVIAAAILARVRKIQWGTGNIFIALLLAAFGVAPFTVLGALGSPIDAVLDLLAGLSFGWLAAVLMESTAWNKFLDAFGIAVVLALLGSAIGYDGEQLILLAILPAFAFAIATVMPARVSGAVLTGLVAAAGLIFFDPTELTILLGDVSPLAIRAVGYTVGVGFVVGVIGLMIQLVTGSGSEPGPEREAGSVITRVAGLVGAGVAWLVVFILFFTNGHHGFYGDRLFVILKDQADLSSIRQIEDIDARRTAAYEMLTEHANQTQAELRKAFDTFGVTYTPYYLVNALEVRGGTLVRLYLLARPEVDRVIPSPRLRPGQGPDALSAMDYATGTTAPSGVLWNVKMIGADRVWDEFGVRGEGIVVGQSDSGADVYHPVLKENYRGNVGGNDYNWFDPWNGEPAPYDDGGHGTHTLGTAVGQSGIGIAPGATWFACMNLDRNLGNPALYLDCMQFMLAPFPQGGDPFIDGDPTRAADVLNNSWGCPEIEGCDPNALLYAANNLRDAGIFVVVSTGNDGPNCSTVDAPLSLYDSVFSVGAVDRRGNVAEFSSRGPVTADGSGRIKPDIVAPGRDIFSSLPGNTYGALEGTSMAGPHVVGAVALLWSADPSLIGDIDRTEQLLIETAQPYEGSTSLGCFEGGTPNAGYGYGLVDVYEAVKEALGK